MSCSMQKRAGFWIALVVPGLFAALIGSGFVSTHRRMAEFRSHIQPGMGVEELERFAGAPAQIVRRGDTLHAVTHSYTLPPLDGQTAVYVYSRDGMPYYTYFVFVDARQQRVTNMVIENLWW